MVVLKKIRFSSENLQELVEVLEDYLQTSIIFKKEDADYIYIDIDGFTKDNIYKDGNGTEIQKTQTPCGTRNYWRWEMDYPIITSLDKL